MPIAAAIPAIASIGSAVIGGIAQGHAASAAAKQQAAGYNKAAAIEQPYNAAGLTALPGLEGLISGNPATVSAQLEQLPGYQFALTQGLKAVQNSASSRGLGVSGAAQKGAAGYATGLADQTFGGQFNRLLQASQLGQNAATAVANAAVGAGTSQAAGTIGVGNAIAGTASNVGGGIIGALTPGNPLYAGGSAGSSGLGSGAIYSGAGGGGGGYGVNPLNIPYNFGGGT